MIKQYLAENHKIALKVVQMNFFSNAYYEYKN